MPLPLAGLAQATTRTAQTEATVPAVTIAMVTELLLPGLPRLPLPALKPVWFEQAQPREAEAVSRRVASELGLLSPPCRESSWVFVAPRHSGQRRRFPQSKAPEPT